MKIPTRCRRCNENKYSPLHMQKFKGQWICYSCYCELLKESRNHNNQIAMKRFGDLILEVDKATRRGNQWRLRRVLDDLDYVRSSISKEALSRRTTFIGEMAFLDCLNGFRQTHTDSSYRVERRYMHETRQKRPLGKSVRTFWKDKKLDLALANLKGISESMKYPNNL